MHSFQPFSIENIAINPFEKIGKEWGLITAGNREKFNTMTVSWGGMGVLWNKNVAFIFIRDSRYTKEFIDRNDFFSVSFLSENYREALNICGSKSGRDVDKFKEANLTPAFRHNIPYVDEANLVFLCNKLSAIPMLDDTFVDKKLLEKFYADKDMHTMYIAEIIESMAR